MCCLVEKPPHASSGAYYWNDLHLPEIKRLRERADRYLIDSRRPIVHGKFVRPSNYHLPKDEKRVVVMNLAGALALANEFNALVNEWKRETGFHSSLSEKFMHPAYQRIIAMGKPVLKYILRDLERTSAHWFHALRYIVNEDVAVGTKTVAEARSAWLEWGYNNGYI